MKEHESSVLINRRQLLKGAAATALLATLPGIESCSGLPEHRPRVAAAGQALALTNCNVIDVVAGVVLPDCEIVVRDGIIESVGNHSNALPKDWLVYDLRGQYVIPGLIDAHCHTTMTSEGQFNIFGLATTNRQFKRNYLQQLTRGVTTVRDMGAMPKLLHDALKMIAKGDLAGPRVVYCNAMTNLDKSHPDIDPRDISVFSDLALAFAGNSSLWFKDTHDLEERMKINSSGGASFIKLTLDNKSLLCGKGELPVYSDEHLRVIMDFARTYKLPVAAHVHTKFGFDRALQYNINSIEHSIGDAALSDRETAAMAQKDIAIVPTMTIAQMFAAPEAYGEIPPQYRTDFIVAEAAIRRQYLNESHNNVIEESIHQANLQSLQNYQKYGCANLYQRGKFMARPDLYFNILLYGPGNLLKMKKAGVTIGCGTDSGVPFVYHGELGREMELLGRIGLTNKEVLQCATINNARILRLADKIGTIEKNKSADLVVLKNNPLENIGACRTPALVVREGRVYDVEKKPAI